MNKESLNIASVEIQNSSKIFVYQKWKKKNFEKINNLKSQIIIISKNI